MLQLIKILLDEFCVGCFWCVVLRVGTLLTVLIPTVAAAQPNNLGLNADGNGWRAPVHCVEGHGSVGAVVLSSSPVPRDLLPFCRGAPTYHRHKNITKNSAQYNSPIYDELKTESAKL